MPLPENVGHAEVLFHSQARRLKMLSQWAGRPGDWGLFTPVLPGSDLMFLGWLCYERGMQYFAM